MLNAEEEAFDSEHLELLPPKVMPRVYHYDYLEMGRAIEQSGTVILNPRDIGQHSLFMADMDWRHDLSIHLQWLRHRRDVRKQAKLK